jgi:alkylation response protein AidB-like acyl-CoA dehydrogenase
MDFAFTEQQEMLRKIARDFLTAECPKDFVRKMVKDEVGCTPEIWNKMAELGWPGLIIPEEYGGIEGSFMDIVALVEETGRASLPGPLVSSLIGTLAILQLGSEEQKKDLLPKIASGEIIVTLAINEPYKGHDLDNIECQAVSDGNEYVIDGVKVSVENAHIADLLLCAARCRHGSAKEGIDLFIIDAKNSSLSMTAINTIAGDKQYQVELKGVRIPENQRLGEAHRGKDQIRRAIQAATVLKCAEMVGGAQQMMDMTVTYVKERVQFDHPIGSLQAIQHHCANMMVDLEGMRYITNLAAWKMSEGLTADKEIAMAKAWCSDAYQRVADLAHQSHGAIGFCEDHDLPLYSKKAQSYDFMYGDAQLQRRFVAKEIGL